MRLVLSERTNVFLSDERGTALRSRAVSSMMRSAYRDADRVMAVSKGWVDILARFVGLPRDIVAHSIVVDPAAEWTYLLPRCWSFLGIGM